MKKVREYKWTEKEEWYDIEDCNGMYQLSNHYRIRSLDREVEDKNGEIRFIEGQILKHNKTSKSGHMMVEIKVGGKRICKGIYVFIAEMFIENPLNLKLVEHRDGNANNNTVENLMWSDHSRNLKTAHYDGARKQIRRIAQYDLNNNFIKYHDSIAEAGLSLGKKANSAIGVCLSGKNASAYGFIWKYVD